jgi:hypothetical protein
MIESCYMCEARATSREHVPPLCLFPKVDVEGDGFRRNLVTVPSCDEHNSKKSADDEFFRALVCSFSGVNEVGQALFFGKTIRAAGRAPRTYQQIWKDEGPFSADKQAFSFDTPRMNRFLVQMVCALHFHRRGTKWDLPIHIILPSLIARVDRATMTPHEESQRLARQVESILVGQPSLGENPLVFSYKLMTGPDSEYLAFSCEFYESFPVFALSQRPVESLVGA